ncbi:hypothetical protein [Streptomyces aureus]|uniref:hypothetical protein n=1 Tax=Streptomyces aureus TaxID=193461 RepID=UPI0005663143|nr:hypothetical protein [Streptomyces aureus]
MTLTSAHSTDGVLLEGRAQRLITSAASVGERAAGQALVEEETILACESVQRGLGLSVSLAAVSGLDERRLAVMLRAIARLAGNDTLAVGTRI